MKATWAMFYLGVHVHVDGENGKTRLHCLAFTPTYDIPVRERADSLIAAMHAIPPSFPPLFASFSHGLVPVMMMSR